jgi:hypothetical protein
MAASSDPDKTITFTTEPDTAGFPAVVNAAFRDAVGKAKLGGDSTQQYFDALNQTSDFWGDLATGKITFAPGLDPHGKPVYMASNGNVEMRIKAEYTGGSEPGTVVGSASVATNNTTTAVSMWTALAVRLATMPPYLKFSGDIFAKLLIPVYKNSAQLLTKLATRIQEATRTETPSIDALYEAEEVTEAQSGVLEEVGAEVGTEGVEFMSIEWGAIALDIAGMAPLMALPMIFEMLGHAMTHALIVQNVTGIDFTWSQSIVHGTSAMKPADGKDQDKLPALKQDSDDDGGQVTLSSSATFQVINTTDYGSVGYVLQLRPSDGSPAATLVVNVPWAGQNAIWTGTADDPQTAFEQHGQPNGKLSTSATFGSYTVTLSLNKLSGKTYDSYYYCSTAVIEPAS